MIKLTDLMMQHFLLGAILNMLFVYNWLKNFIRHFIKIHFDNKGTKIINLPSIF